ncbi:MAG TPA: GNAT family N-acetyltransferase [Ardenticatenaceae bacterium]|nr:GNAT family N-acetyltransferase [Ardenticatenaceae bacterium]
MREMDGISTVPIEAWTDEVEANLWEAWTNFGLGPGCTLHDEGDALWFETPIPLIPYNGVLKFQVEKNVDQRIDTVIRHFRARGVPFLWVVHPTGSPPSLAEQLQERGVQEIELMPGMARSLAELPDASPLPEGVEVREAIEESDVREIYEFAAWRWGVPEAEIPQLGSLLRSFRIGQPDSKLRMWLAWRDGVPVSKLGLYHAAGSAGIYGVVTKVEARGLGLASVLMVEALKAAKAKGQELAVLHSSPLAENLYKRLGFVTVTHLRLFASEPTYI